MLNRPKKEPKAYTRKQIIVFVAALFAIKFVLYGVAALGGAL